jgi:hypothetical protein
VLELIIFGRNREEGGNTKTETVRRAFIGSNGSWRLRRSLLKTRSREVMMEDWGDQNKFCSCSSPDIIGWGNERWVGHVAPMEEIQQCIQNICRKTGRDTLEDVRRERKIILKLIVIKGVGMPELD